MVEQPAWVGLGSNVGDRAATLTRAIEALERSEGVRVLRVSQVLETEPVGVSDQARFLNAAAAIATTRSPRALLALLHRLEADAGRDRTAERRWGPRTLDLDLLLYADRVLDEGGLTVPHPRMHERLFVLETLAQIAPSVVHPILGATIESLRDRLVAETGPSPTGHQPASR